MLNLRPSLGRLDRGGEVPAAEVLELPCAGYGRALAA
jgi:hypothetical protein